MMTTFSGTFSSHGSHLLLEAKVVRRDREPGAERYGAAPHKRPVCWRRSTLSSVRVTETSPKTETDTWAAEEEGIVREKRFSDPKARRHCTNAADFQTQRQFRQKVGPRVCCLNAADDTREKREWKRERCFAPPKGS